MKKIEFEIEVGKYISSATLSVELRKKKISRTYQLQRNNESLNMAHILALKEGLNHITEPVEIEFILNPGYLTISLESVEKWAKNDFRNNKGEEIKYKDYWKDISEELKKHKFKIKFKEKKNETM